MRTWAHIMRTIDLRDPPARTPALSLAVATAGCSSESASHDVGQEDEFKASDFAEGEVLPYAGDPRSAWDLAQTYR